MDSMAERILRHLAAALAGLVGLQLLFWVPQYLTWPWWADHDVFGTMALGWDRGLLPYRDLLGNNFPGTIYLFWIAGKLFGWGKTWPFYALDVGMLLTLLAALLIWSRRLFGTALPGMVGAAAAVTLYLELDFSMTAQRDWQGPLLAAVGLLTLQAYPDRRGRLASAALLALGFSIRPQVVLFGGGYLLALIQSGRTKGESARIVAGFAAAFAAGVALLALPLARDGLLADFWRGFRVVTGATEYNRLSLVSFGYRFAFQFLRDRSSLPVVPLAMLGLAAIAAPNLRRAALVWAAVTAGVILYLPLSPVMRKYLELPLQLTWAIDLAVLAALVLEARPASAVLRLAAVGLLIGLGVKPMPRYCSPTELPRAIPALRRGVDTETPPSGFQLQKFSSLIPFEWDEYRPALEYLRTRTGPETRVANAVVGLAICAPVARLPVFPAESATWLWVVNKHDEPRFAAALEDAGDSVVVWAPEATGEASIHWLERLEAAIRRHYEPEARFGRIEIWRRKPISGGTGPERIPG